MRLCIIRHTIYDLKGYGLCRERHCLWAVPLLILDFAVLAAQTPGVPCGASGVFLFIYNFSSAHADFSMWALFFFVLRCTFVVFRFLPMRYTGCTRRDVL
nr:MAG TPA: hypothetical protein [Caudoviricetes sp.]